MTTFQIDTNDKSAIEDIKRFIVNKFHFQVQVVDDVKTLKTEPKSKWAKVAEEMRGTMTKEDVEYLQACSKEFREGFELREYK